MSIELEVVLCLLLAAALGVIIGYQREGAGKPAGLRTHILICAGAGLYLVATVATVVTLIVLFLPRPIR